MSSRTGLGADDRVRNRGIQRIRNGIIGRAIAGCNQEAENQRLMEVAKDFKRQKSLRLSHLVKNKIRSGSLVCNTLSGQLGMVFSVTNNFQVIVNGRQCGPEVLLVVKVGDLVRIKKVTDPQLITAIKKGKVYAGEEKYSPCDLEVVASRWPRKK